MRKFIALCLMLWLPIFSMSAAAMVSCPHGGDMSAMSDMPMAMDDDSVPHDMDGDQHAAHHAADSSHSTPAHDCGQCGICHIACSPGLVSTARQIHLSAVGSDSVAVNTHFLSIVLPIFEPPPLTRV